MFFLWLNIISGFIIAAIFLLIIIFDRKNVRSEMQNIKLIALGAFLVAISVFLNSTVKVLLNTIISAKIFEAKLGNFALVLIGFFCGGTLGVLSGIAADFLGLIIYSSGAPVLFYTLTSVIWCVLPYYLVRILVSFKNNKWLIYFYLPATYAFTLLLITGINPIVLKYMYNLEGWWILYLPRIIKFPIDVLVNSFLLIIIYRIFANSNHLNSKLYQIANNKKIKKDNRDNKDKRNKRKELKPKLINIEGATDD